MAKFLRTTDVNAELARLIREAESEIVLISPFIKLHSSIRAALEVKKQRPEISLTIVFGKNADNISQSLGKDDFEFFREFSNVEIRYSELLHAKYYANESAAILTSMNLYDYSQNNNIEFGILLKTNLVKDIAVAITGDGSLDSQAYGYFQEEVIPQARVMFRREPQYDKGIAGTGLNKKYLGSVETENKLDALFGEKNNAAKTARPVPKPSFRQTKPAVPATGYCIRTGTPIPFNIERPLSEDAYRSWSKFSNPDYPEKYCHFSGEPSNGETTFSRPVLNKNWARAKTLQGIQR